MLNINKFKLNDSRQAAQISKSQNNSLYKLLFYKKIIFWFIFFYRLIVIVIVQGLIA